MSTKPNEHMHSSTKDSSETPASASHSFLRGIKLGFPIFLGYVPVGLAFGILAVQKGFSILEAVLCSATALAGAGQFIALATMAAGGDAVTTVIATSVVNLRYVLFAATVSPYLKRAPMGIMAWLGFTLTDESFAVNINDLREGKANPISMAGVGFIAWVGWIAGTVVGATSSSWIGDPSKWGVDFAMPAMFAALFVALAENRRHVITGIGAACIVLALYGARMAGVVVDSNWFIVIAALAGATLAVFIFRNDHSTLAENAVGDEMLVTQSSVGASLESKDGHE